MKWQHYNTNCLSHRNTCNYSLSAIDYNNYIDSYDLGKKTYNHFPKITLFLQYWLNLINETLKQTLILAIAKNPVSIITVSVPHMANNMPIHMVKTALYPIIIQFDEETIQLM